MNSNEIKSDENLNNESNQDKIFDETVFMINLKQKLLSILD